MVALFSTYFSSGPWITPEIPASIVVRGDARISVARIEGDAYVAEGGMLRAGYVSGRVFIQGRGYFQGGVVESDLCVSNAGIAEVVVVGGRLEGAGDSRSRMRCIRGDVTVKDRAEIFLDYGEGRLECGDESVAFVSKILGGISLRSGGTFLHVQQCLPFSFGVVAPEGLEKEAVKGVWLGMPEIFPGA